MNHQLPSMTGRHVSDPLAGLATCPVMKIEERKSYKKMKTREEDIKRGKGRKRKIEKK